MKRFIESLIVAIRKEIRKIRGSRVKHFEWKVNFNDKSQEYEA